MKETVTGRVTARAEGSFVVLVLAGEHDVATAADIRDGIRSSLALSRGVLVDLTACTFVDASVLRELHAGGEEARAQARWFVLVPPDDGRFARVFSIAEVDWLSTAASVDEGLARLQIEAVRPSDLRLALASMLGEVVEEEGVGNGSTLLARADRALSSATERGLQSAVLRRAARTTRAQVATRRRLRSAAGGSLS